MADRVVYTKEASRAGVKALADTIADKVSVPPKVGTIRFFDETIVLDEDTTRDVLVAAETKLMGYPVGGYDITAFSNPTFAPLGGAIVTSNLINVEYASGPAAMIGGYWVEDAALPNPNVRYAVKYDPPRTLAEVGNGWPVVVQLGYGANVLGL